MNIAEENQAQLNKRQAIQAIMRDTSLTPQEKQKKIQQIMASGAQAVSSAPALAPPSARTPAPEPIMSQPQVQPVMANPRGAPTTAAPAYPASSPRVGAMRSTGMDPAARKGARGSSGMTASATAAIAREGSEAEIKGASAAFHDSASVMSGTTVEPDAMSIPSVGAVASTGVDPAARKGGRGLGASLHDTASVMSGTTTVTDAMSIPTVGAVASAGVDPAARKGGRGLSASLHDAASVMSGTTTETDGMSIPTVGAVASTSADPAARKGGRSTTRISTRTSSASNVSSNDVQSVGAASASHHDDPALRKAPRTTRTSGLAAATNLHLEPMITMEEPKLDGAMASNSTQMAHRNNVGDLQSVPNVQPRGLVPPAQAPAPVPDLPPPSLSYSAPTMGTRQVVPTPEEPPQQQETYASPGVMSPAMEEGDAVGIQAYVAGEDREVVVGATHVVTEDEIAEEENKKQARVIRLGGIICCLLLVAVVVPIGVVVPKDDNFVEISEAPSYAPSTAPTGALFADLLDALQPLYPDEESYQAAFADATTPQYQAAQWATDNAVGLTGSDPRMISRYALATFYYATNGDDWERCGVGSTDCEAGREWLTAENECDWLAIACADPAGGNYTVLELYFPPKGPTGNNIAGTLPFEVALLSSLHTIILSKQALQGSIPETWSRLTNLETFIIGTNQLTGTFPDFLFFENSLLGTLYLSINNLTGSLPALSSPALRDLDIGSNLFTGPIPKEFGTLTGLVNLDVSSNVLTGPLPEECYNLSGLRVLTLSNNKLTGTLSENIANFQNLTIMRIANNTMGGPLPSGLFDLINLQILNIAGNLFAGSLPVDFARLSNATQILLSNNTFAGAVTDGFDSLTMLTSLTLHANSLTGTISASLCSRVGEGLMDLKQLTADCSETPPEVTCDCCTECF